VSDFGSKPGIGKTGVHLRYHNNAEYKVLPKNQRDELREWRMSNPGKRGAGKHDSKDGKKTRFSADKAMTSAIEKGVEKELAKRDKAAKKAEKTVKEEEGANLLLDFLTEAAAAVGRKNKGGANASSATAAVSTSTVLKGILKKAQVQAKKDGE
jgi:hypothetical protein